jgi:hypothetical protein
MVLALRRRRRRRGAPSTIETFVKGGALAPPETDPGVARLCVRERFHRDLGTASCIIGSRSDRDSLAVLGDFL